MNATTPLGIAIPAQAAAVPPLASAAPSVVPLVEASAPIATAITTPAANATSGTFLPGAASGWGSYFQAIAWFCFSIAMLWLLVWLFKKARGNFLPSSVPNMSIESRLALGPKKWVIVARFLDRRLVLGVTDHQITLLTELGIDDEPEKDDSHGRSFASLLKGANKNNPEQPVRLTGLDIETSDSPGRASAPRAGSFGPSSGGGLTLSSRD